MDCFQNMTQHEIATYSCDWGQATIEDKARKYTARPERRRLYALLENDHGFSLFSNIDTSLWSELANFNLMMLNRGEKDTEMLLKILEIIPPRDGIAALRYITHPTRISIVDRLMPESRQSIMEHLAEVEIENFKEVRNDPKAENFFIATPGFLQTLPPSARQCSGDGCSSDVFPSFHPFKITQSLKQSYHLACFPTTIDMA